MDRDRLARPLWDLDPGDQVRPGYADYEQFFCAAYEASFGLPASPERVRRYLLRYLRFYVLAPWVREYAVRAPRGPVSEELADAPLDPVFDLRYPGRGLGPCRVTPVAGGWLIA